MRWKAAFDHQILMNGQADFEGKKIFDFVDDGERITAHVNDESIFDVSIIYDEQFPKIMSCTCTAAQKGYKCRHMAATLYQWESIEEVKMLSEIKAFALSAPENELRSLLLFLIQKNSTILRAVSEEIQDREQGGELLGEFDSIVDQYSDENRTISIWQTLSFSRDIHRIIEKHFSEEYCEEHIMDAFTDSTLLYRNLNDLSIDDSNGVLVELLSHLCAVWASLLEIADDIEEMVILEWLENEGQKEERLSSFVEEFYEDMIMSDEDQGIRFS